jgi:hypothetical protein
LSVVLVAPRTEVIDEEGRRSNHIVEDLDTRHLLPHQRMADVFRSVEWATAQNGLFRTECLKKTRLHEAYYASDYVLLAEVALLGEIWQLPETLFQKRFHSGISIKANKDWREFQTWFDPSQKLKRPLLSPRMRLGLEFVRSITRMRMSTWERVSCYSTVLLSWYSREFRRLAAEGRNKIAFRTKLRKVFKSLGAL